MLETIWTLLLVCVSHTAKSNEHDKFVLFYGETQTGKSSVINAIYGKNVAPVGSGNGISMTEYPTIYSKSFTKDEATSIPFDFSVHMMDSPGNLDNRELFTDQDILNNILYALSQINNIEQIDAVFITESLAGDSLQLTRNVKKLKEVFGTSITDSIVVLGTKPMKGSQANDGKQNKKAAELCGKLGINKYMTYESNEGYSYQNQLQAMMQVLFGSEIRPYKMKGVEEVRAKIESRAQELMEQTPKKEEIIEVEQQVIKYKDVQKQETYWDRRWGEVGRGGRRYGLFGPRKRIDGWIPVQKTRTITVKEAYETKEMVPTKVTIEHDPEKFREIAREEWRQSLKLNISFKQEL